MATRTIRIGSGSGWWGDRVEPAALSAQHGRLDFLCFETMAEATVSAAQVRKRRDASFEGYDTYLDSWCPFFYCRHPLWFLNPPCAMLVHCRMLWHSRFGASCRTG